MKAYLLPPIRMALEKPGTRVENKEELRDFISVAAVLKDVVDKELSFVEAVEAQMKANGIEASDELVAELAAELEEEALQAA